MSEGEAIGWAAWPPSSTPPRFPAVCAGIYDPAFIAANQEARADNIIKGSRQEQVDTVRQQIRDFKANSGVDKVGLSATAPL